ncbi:hypothetical protein BJ166DRAFT_237986 [Pestalotiopsis sp. NC0098]|nr:hypothetical protein BJ166DRAFT_237986 [Pestalotiopsis sp. NC0098]
MPKMDFCIFLSLPSHSALCIKIRDFRLYSLVDYVGMLYSEFLSTTTSLTISFPLLTTFKFYNYLHLHLFIVETLSTQPSCRRTLAARPVAASHGKLIRAASTMISLTFSHGQITQTAAIRSKTFSRFRETLSSQRRENLPRRPRGRRRKDQEFRRRRLSRGTRC